MLGWADEARQSDECLPGQSRVVLDSTMTERGLSEHPIKRTSTLTTVVKPVLSHRPRISVYCRDARPAPSSVPNRVATPPRSQSVAGQPRHKRHGRKLDRLLTWASLDPET